MPRLVLSLFFFSAFLFASNANALEPVVVLDTNHYHHIDRALEVLNCTRDDAGFTKDVVTNLLWSFEPVRDLLEDPFELDPLAGRLLAAMAHTNGPDARAILEPMIASPEFEREHGSWDLAAPAGLDPAFTDIIRAIVANDDFGLLVPLAPSFDDPANGYRDLLSAQLMSQLDFIPWPELEPRLEKLGLGDSDTLRADRERLDPSPAIKRKLDQLTNTHWQVAAPVTRDTVLLIRSLLPELDQIEAWPEKPVEFARGIWIGSPNDDTYSKPFALLIEPGGNDTYTGHAAAASPTNPVSILIERGGNDRYHQHPARLRRRRPLPGRLPRTGFGHRRRRLARGRRR